VEEHHQDMYEIKPIETEKSKIPLKKCMKDGTIPPAPFSMMISGRSGSGKTNLLINLLTKKELLKDYFHQIIVFSPTAGEFDDTYRELGLKKENFKNDFNSDDLDRLISNRKELISKKGIEFVCKNSRILIIMDDIIANRDFLNSPEALKMFALLRHYQVSIIVLVQSYNKLPRALRINANCLMIFPSILSEVEVIIDEVCPMQLTKKQFKSVIEYCTSGRYDFLYINNKAPIKERIRKNLGEILNLDNFTN